MRTDILSRVRHLLEMGQKCHARSSKEDELILEHLKTLYHHIPCFVEYDTPHMLRDFQEYCEETFLICSDIKSRIHSISLSRFFSLKEHTQPLLNSFFAHIQQHFSPGKTLFTHLTHIHTAACRTKPL